MAKVAKRLPSNLWQGLPVAHTQRKINPSTPPRPSSPGKWRGWTNLRKIDTDCDCDLKTCQPNSFSSFILFFVLFDVKLRRHFCLTQGCTWPGLLTWPEIGTFNTIRQRRRPWKRRWKIDSASFQTISRLFQVAQLLKRREFKLQLKKGGRTRVQTEMVEFIALPFPCWKKLL